MSGKEDTAALPRWAELVRQKYLGGEASVFLLHGNVFDHVLHGGREYSLADFLTGVLLKGNKDIVVTYDPANGLRVIKSRQADALAAAFIASERNPLAEIQALLESSDRVAVLILYAGSIVPPGDESMLSEQDRTNAVRLHQWSMSEYLGGKDNVVFLLSESLAEINGRLVSNPRMAAVKVPLPDEDARRTMIEHVDPTIDPANRNRLAEQTSGLRLVQIDQILSPREPAAIDIAARRVLVRELTGGDQALPETVEKLVALTRGMTAAQIRERLKTSIADVNSATADPYAAVLDMVYARKREVIETECAGLIEFVDSKHGLDAVGGNVQIKQELATVADALRSGDKRRSPMGLLFVGPMGTGKTFVARAFVKSSGLSAVMLKNFRSKWVGSTEANLERVLNMIRAMGPIILMIDEGDRSFGGQSEDSDGGTSSRVIARLKEFMSDPDNRGVVVFLLMTNRPDKLDVDIKRAGRLDVKIPFFYEDTKQGVLAILSAMARRYELDETCLANCEKLIGYSNADLEAVVLLAVNYAYRDGTAVTAESFERAAADYLPAHDTEMLEYMELLAVSEASRRTMLPKKFRELSALELQERLGRLRILTRN